MATSSIFTKVKISDPKKAEAFIDALTAAETKPKRKSSTSMRPPLTDHDAIRHLMTQGDVDK